MNAKDEKLWIEQTIFAEVEEFWAGFKSKKSILDFSVMRKKADALAKKEGKIVYSLIPSIFSELCLRGELPTTIKIKDKSEALDKKTNYLIIPTDTSKNAAYCIFKFKTSKKYPVLQGEFSAETTKLLRQYAGQKPYDIPFFDNLDNDMRHMLDMIGAKNAELGKGSEGLWNYFRHSILSYSIIGVLDDRKKLSKFSDLIKTARHKSTTTIGAYVYNVRKK